ncbi:unnamed protein product [Bursaphelenchus xylophilus]|uniref:(pine wood nematode) hypothetical protein n=1 Tax=Bursaphelenchus xylophilus TaxID=6326 RepID=A0A1I7SB54_BURXY|nr:unnamed protein product [Bursaphelenchus xylophilus]CAG9131757.1 unnamed protein product [Bursaphelenchus xylophilus]
MEDVNLGNSHEPTVSSEVNELKKYHSQPEHTHSLPLSSNSSNTRKCYRCNGPRAHECLKNSIEGSFNKGKANINVVEYYAQTMVSQYTENFKEEMGQGTHSIQMREDDTQIPTFKCTFNSSKGRCYTDPLRFNSKEGRCYTGPSQFNSIRRCYTDLLDDKVQLSLSIGHDLQIMQSQIPQRIKELPKNSPFKDPDPCPCSENSVTDTSVGHNSFNGSLKVRKEHSKPIHGARPHSFTKGEMVAIQLVTGKQVTGKLIQLRKRVHEDYEYDEMVEEVNSTPPASSSSNLFAYFPVPNRSNGPEDRNPLARRVEPKPKCQEATGLQSTLHLPIQALILLHKGRC